MTPDYIDTVRLLLAIAPTVFASGRFAMKGGTALNLFVQDMPRLSVDIDVVYVDHHPDREAALETISAELVAMKAALKAKGYRATLPASTRGDEVKLVVGNDATQVKVEVNFVFRGSVLPVETRSLVATAQDLFTTDEEVSLDALVAVQARLIADLPRQLTERQRSFLMSLVRTEPDWALLPFSHLQVLPALKWKLLNLAKLKKSDATRFRAQADELARRMDDVNG